MSATVLMVAVCEKSVYLNDINQIIYSAVLFQQNVSVVTLVLLHVAMSACLNANLSCTSERKTMCKQQTIRGPACKSLRL